MIDWRGLDVRSLDEAAVDALLSGQAAYLRVSGFLSDRQAEDIVRRFMEGPHDERDYGATKTLQVGVALSAEPPERYFERSSAANRAVRALYEGMKNPVDEVRGTLARRLGWVFTEPSENNLPYCTNVVAAMNPGTLLPIHCDLPRDQRIQRSSFFISKFPRLLTFNVYLSTSDHGGQLVIYRRKVRLDEEQPSQCAFAFRDVPRAVVSPRPGDLVVFDPDHFHEVLRVGGERLRFTSQWFISLDPGTGRAACWS